MMPHFISRQNLAFTLLEVLAVLTIVAILGGMAIPSYHQGIVAKQILEGLALAEVVKRPVAQSWAEKQSFPQNNVVAELPEANKIVNNVVKSIELQDGVITITFGNSVAAAIHGKILTLRPATVDDAPVVPVVWVCAQADVPGNMRALGSDRSNIPKVFLPRVCRSVSKEKNMAS